jgi:hypothetical protein
VQSGTNEPSSYVVAGGVATLTIPIEINVQFAVFSDDPDTNFRIFGQLVAMASVQTPTTTVVGRQVFYNESVLDGQNAAVTAQDLAAIATDKQALLPGGQGGFANVTSYSKGINGVLVSFSAGSSLQTLTADDFDFRVGRSASPNAFEDGPAPTAVTLIAGPTAEAGAKYAVTFANGAIRNQWLEVAVKANSRTGLSSPDVFYFGNLVGETGNNPAALATEAADLVRTRNAIGSGAAAITNVFDHDRSGAVSASDLVICRNNIGRTLPRLLVPISQQSGHAAAPVSLFSPERVAFTPRESGRRDDLELLD